MPVGRTASAPGRERGPPWGRTESPPPRTRPAQAAASTAPPAATAEGAIHGNRRSKVYRVPGCTGYATMQPASVVPFATEAAAQQAGYRKAKDCS